MKTLVCSSPRADDVEVTPLKLAELELPGSHPMAPGSDMIYGYLVRDGPACILVDTGVGTGSALIDRLYKPEREDLEDALNGAGVSLGEVTAVVNSHLHFDHCGNNFRFPGIPIYVQQAELEAAYQPHYTVLAWVEFPGASYVPVQGNHSISPHVEIISTPGHSPGHQSLLVHLGERLEVIVAQAAFSAAEFDAFGAERVRRSGGRSPAERQAFVDANATGSRESYLASLATLHRCHPQRAFFSHDADPWERANTPSP